MYETFEYALDGVLRDAEAAQRAGIAVVKAGKKLAAAAKVGDVAAIEKAIRDLTEATTQVAQQSTNTKDGWDFDLGAYAHSGGLRDEIFARASKCDLQLTEQDGRIFSYPSLVRLITSERSADCAIKIDKKISRALRPSYVIDELKRRRDAKPRFNTSAFAQSLYAAYRALNVGSDSVPLLSIYDLLVLFPGQRRDYSTQEFARDIAILDASDVDTVSGRRISFPASTGTRQDQRKTLRVVDRDGRELVYWGIRFSEQPQQ